MDSEINKLISTCREVRELTQDLWNCVDLWPYERSYVTTRLQQLTAQCKEYENNLTSMLKAPISHIEPFA